MSGSYYLEHVFFHPDARLTYLGDEFMSKCPKLEYIDLSICSDFVEIGDDFLHECRSLKEIDLSPLGRVTKIGRNFVMGTGAKHIDWRPVRQAEQ